MDIEDIMKELDDAKLELEELQEDADCLEDILEKQIEIQEIEDHLFRKRMEE